MMGRYLSPVSPALGRSGWSNQKPPDNQSIHTYPLSTTSAYCPPSSAKAERARAGRTSAARIVAAFHGIVLLRAIRRDGGSNALATGRALIFSQRAFGFLDFPKTGMWRDPNRAPRANEPRRTVPGRGWAQRRDRAGPHVARAGRRPDGRGGCAPGWCARRKGAWQPQGSGPAFRYRQPAGRCSGPDSGATKRGLIRGLTGQRL